MTPSSVSRRRPTPKGSLGHGLGEDIEEEEEEEAENWVTLPVQRPGSSAVPPSLRPLMPDSDEGGQLNPDDDWQVSERSYDGAEAVLDARSVKFADAPTCDLRAPIVQLPTASAEEVERLPATQISGEVDTASLAAVMAGVIPSRAGTVSPLAGPAVEHLGVPPVAGPSDTARRGARAMNSPRTTKICTRLLSA